jgi:nicotinamidase-related amidase
MQDLTLDKSSTVLLVVDVQEKLAAAMPDESCGRVVDNIGRLVRGAGILGIPVLVTEQYPKGLGPSIEPLREALAEVEPAPLVLEKTEFNACANPAIADALKQLSSAGSSVVVSGMESHICVYQTARALAAEGFQVHVPQDAACSRTLQNHAIARDLWQRAGAIPTSTETVLFDLLGRAEGDAFKAISKLVR